MPTARRVLAATGLFAAVVAAGTPALATPGTHGHKPTVRAAMAGQSATAAEHGAAHKPAKAHPSHPAHAKKTKTVTVTSASTATGSSGKTAKVHTAHKTVTRAAGAATTSNGKHRGKDARSAAAPAKATPANATPTKSRPTTGKPAKGTGTTPTETGTKPAVTPAKTAATSQARAAFGETVQLSSGRPATAPRPAPVVEKPIPKPSTSPAPQAGSGIPPALNPEKVIKGIGQTLTNLTGIGLFSGPQGWIFTTMLLLAVVMMIGAFALGRRPKTAR